MTSAREETAAVPPPVSGGGARRRWLDLPFALREQVEGVLGSPVIAAASQPGGFSPGSADRVVTAAGRRAFVKAVSGAINAEALEIHRREAAILPLLPAVLPVAGLIGVAEHGDWIALALDDVPGRHPSLPWRSDELDSVLDAFADLAGQPVGGPLADVLPPLGDRLPAGWSQVGPDARLALPEETADWCLAHFDRLQQQEAAARDLVGGDRLVHLDARADNLLLGADGRVTILDWPWAARGAGWFDALSLLVNVRLFDPGFDVEAVIATHPVFADMPHEAVPAVLAAFAGFFSVMGSQPPPPGLPTLRRFQLDQAVVTIDWLRERWPG